VGSARFPGGARLAGTFAGGDACNLNFSGADRELQLSRPAPSRRYGRCHSLAVWNPSMTSLRRATGTETWTIDTPFRLRTSAPSAASLKTRPESQSNCGMFLRQAARGRRKPVDRSVGPPRHAFARIARLSGVTTRQKNPGRRSEGPDRRSCAALGGVLPVVWREEILPRTAGGPGSTRLADQTPSARSEVRGTYGSPAGALPTIKRGHDRAHTRAETAWALSPRRRPATVGRRTGVRVIGPNKGPLSRPVRRVFESGKLRAGPFSPKPDVRVLFDSRGFQGTQVVRLRV